MCANCKVVGVKLDGDNLVTVYSAGVAETLKPFAAIGNGSRFRGAGRDTEYETWSEMSYAATKLDHMETK